MPHKFTQYEMRLFAPLLQITRLPANLGIVRLFVPLRGLSKSVVADDICSATVRSCSRVFCNVPLSHRIAVTGVVADVRCPLSRRPSSVEEASLSLEGAQPGGHATELPVASVVHRGTRVHRVRIAITLRQRPPRSYPSRAMCQWQLVLLTPRETAN